MRKFTMLCICLTVVSVLFSFTVGADDENVSGVQAAQEQPAEQEQSVQEGETQPVYEPPVTAETSALPATVEEAIAMGLEPTGEEEIKKAYQINPGDVLHICAFGAPELHDPPVISRVEDDGTIIFPLVGQIKVAGMTASEAAKMLDAMLSDGYLTDPQVTVFIAERPGAAIGEEVMEKFTLYGQVLRPGQYRVRDDLTVSIAVIEAGGFTNIAAKNAVKVIRLVDGKKKVMKVPVAHIFRTGNTRKDVAIEKDDIVVIPESWF